MVCMFIYYITKVYLVHGLVKGHLLEASVAEMGVQQACLEMSIFKCIFVRLEDGGVQGEGGGSLGR